MNIKASNLSLNDSSRHPRNLSDDRMRYLCSDTVRLVIFFVWSACMFGGCASTNQRNGAQNDHAKGNAPFVAYSARRVSAISFAEIKTPGQAVASVDLTLGILPIENPFWTVEDNITRLSIDYSGYSIDLCERLMEHASSVTAFASVIEIPRQMSVTQASGQDLCRRWGVDLVLSGRVIDPKGVLEITVHSAEATVFQGQFDRCWDLAGLCSRLCTAVCGADAVQQLALASAHAKSGRVTLVQPVVTTARVNIRFLYSEEKPNRGNVVGGAIVPPLLPLVAAVLIRDMTSPGADAEGQLLLFLDGRNVGGRLTPSNVGAFRRTYDWSTEMAVRPGKHRLVVGGKKTERNARLNTNTSYFDFDLRDAETVTINIAPSKEGDRWNFTVDRHSFFQIAL